jgi:hypothetical protein
MVDLKAANLVAYSVDYWVDLMVENLADLKVESSGDLNLVVYFADSLAVRWLHCWLIRRSPSRLINRFASRSRTRLAVLMN